MDSIKIRTMTRWKYYALLFGSMPLLIFVPVFVVIVNGLHKYWGYGLAFLMLYSCVLLAHVLSRKWTTFSQKDGIVQFDTISIASDTLENYHINKAGIGVTQFEFNLKSGQTIKILVPNYRKNAQKLEEFYQVVFPQEKYLKR